MSSTTESTVEIALAASHRRQPLGIPAHRGVMLSWSISGEFALDRARGVDVRVGETAEKLDDDPVWSVSGVQSSSVRYGGLELRSRDVRYWQVTAYAVDGTAFRSEVARFEVGLEDESDWSATWVSAPLLEFRRETWDPAPLLRQRFELDALPTAARLYATALGIYRLWINGVPITHDALFRPGWTDYRYRVLHQTFDVASALRLGENVVAVELAKGWYAGRLGLQREPAFYGEQPALRLQLEADGAVVAATDAQWRYSYGAIVATDMLVGETQDLRQAQPGWDAPGFDDLAWRNVTERADLDVAVTPQPHDPVTTYREIEGTLVRAHARGPAVYDFGQNMVGWTRVRSRTLPKADVIVRHGEILTPDDLVWRDNLRGAFQEDRYTTGDDAMHVLEPRHTLHGFRFAEVWGIAPKEPYLALEVPDDVRVTAIAVGGGQRAVGSFECSDAALTSVASLVEWTVRDNFIEVITDCPQRDERLGWLGDAGVIAQSAAYHFDIAAFVAKFTRDAADSQTEDGAILSYVPPVPPGTFREGAPGWADGYVRLVHLAAQRYGDLATAEEHYDHIARYLKWVDDANPSGIRTERVGADFSDWLSLPEDPNEPPHPGYAYTGARSTSSKRVVATAHTIRSLDQFADIARRLGRHEDAARYSARADEVRAAYAAAFVDARGRIEGDTQTVYAQAIGYDVLRGDLRARAVARLAEKVRELGHVTTGIHGVEHIIPALARNGHADLAAGLLLREEMPSWKHMVAMGATTVWEKWDGIAADGTMSTAEMNSFNHCALGAVGEFLFESVAGLDAREAVRDGVLTVAPLYLDGLDWARARHESAAGPVESSWQRDGGAVAHEIAVPPSMVARYAAPVGYRLSGGGVAAEFAGGRHIVRLEPV
ncbi:family 78 glycoside hydrolase catalytic domain [Leifsonia sp. H3M29-4]|uniref:alpha-L-rhamnosidase n=1 Tax=Salinibacterium metalliresistens TaxID=3031321 RepID=UPI0023DA0346|nr:alpha-L-rhamnosidase [Salinibacterium metalliresistens]MDF1478607.1 family 78 glycoside hydrolase catalytic domain [Salinibacterium metalliresistens]